VDLDLQTAMSLLIAADRTINLLLHCAGEAQDDVLYYFETATTLHSSLESQS
jgi:hypothetical protein